MEHVFTYLNYLFLAARVQYSANHTNVHYTVSLYGASTLISITLK